MYEKALCRDISLGKTNMIVYTDGSCHGNPGKGGWACYCPETDFKRCGAEMKTTNNRMELTAILWALQTPGVTTIITDSDYCLKGCTKWIKGWVRNDWKTASGTGVKNDDLWKKILELEPDRVEFQWVKAHASNEHNNYVDQLANKAIDALPVPDTVATKRSRLEKELIVLDKRREEIMQNLKELEM